MAITKLKTNKECKFCKNNMEIGTPVWITRTYQYGRVHYTFMDLNCALDYYNKIKIENINAKAPDIIIEGINNDIKKIKNELKKIK